MIFYSEAAPKSVLKRRELIVPSLKIYRLPPTPKKKKQFIFIRAIEYKVICLCRTLE